MLKFIDFEQVERPVLRFRRDCVTWINDFLNVQSYWFDYLTDLNDNGVKITLYSRDGAGKEVQINWDTFVDPDDMFALLRD